MGGEMLKKSTNESERERERERGRERERERAGDRLSPKLDFLVEKSYGSIKKKSVSAWTTTTTTTTTTRRFRLAITNNPLDDFLTSDGRTTVQCPRKSKV